jgi:N-acetylmuramoyl-L-alanine amidase
MKKLLILIISVILLSSNYATVKASEESVAGMSVTLDNADAETVKSAFNEIKFTKKEVKVLYRLVEAECTGCDVESKKNVASVVINRMLDTSFEDTISDVVFEKNQFSCIDDKRYYDVEITDETKEAVNDVVKNGVTTEATYYCNLKNTSSKMKRWYKSKLTYLFVDTANHSFYIEIKED